MSDKPLEDMTTPASDVDKEIEDGLAKMAEEETAEQGEETNATQEQEAEETTEEEPQAEPEKQQPDSVPLNVALDWKRQAKTLGQEVSALKSQMQDLLTAVKGKDESGQEPSLLDQPVEHLAFQSKQVREEIESLKEALASQTQHNQLRTMQTEINNIESNFAAKQPDYWDATKFLTEHRINELQTVFGFSEEEADQRFSEETARFIQAATSRGESFAEAAYKMAQQYGFKPAQAAEEEPAEKKAEEAKKGEDSLKEIARKQQQARTLSNAGGKTPKDELTAADVNELSDEEFDKQFTGEEGTKRLKEIFGG